MAVLEVLEVPLHVAPCVTNTPHCQLALRNRRKKHKVVPLSPMDPEGSGRSCEHTPVRDNVRAYCTKCTREFKLIPWPKTGKDRKLITAISPKELITADVQKIIGRNGWKLGLVCVFHIPRRMKSLTLK